MSINLYIRLFGKANFSRRTNSVLKIYRIVEAIGKHIMAEQALAGGGEGVSVEEAGGGG